MNAPNLFLNFEVKGPLDKKTWLTVYDPIYDYDELALAVLFVIEKYDVGWRTMLSSFNPECYESCIRMSMPPRKRDFIITILAPGRITFGYLRPSSWLRPYLR